MFGSRKSKQQSPRELYDGLRGQALAIEPAADEFHPSAALPNVWGALLETGYGPEVATLLCLSDGTTSLYTTSGFVIIGGGGHEQVVSATRAFLGAVEAALDAFIPETAAALPGDGETIMHALTFTGLRAIHAPELDLGEGRHPQSAVFHAGQAVITELRLLSEAHEAR
ncbi:MAG TPA: hypothetical protein VG650_18825 [Mycobacteriales bacterium]|nr:hypothetical protein [Mycobacteriales bacterium]